MPDNTTTETAPATETAKGIKQHVLAVSERCKAFFNDCRAAYSAPGKTKDDVPASEREIGDAILEFIDANRMQSRTTLNEETGEEETVEFDAFELEVKRTLAQRATTSRANSAAAKVAALEKEKAELQALLAKLTAKAGE